jgi:hypothetical protein
MYDMNSTLIEGAAIMKKYMLFQFDEFYPKGGIRDFAVEFDFYDEFKKLYKFKAYDFYQLVNTSDFSHKLLRFAETDKDNKKKLFDWIEDQIE